MESLDIAESHQSGFDLDFSAFLDANLTSNTDPDEIDLSSDLLSSLLNPDACGLLADADVVDEEFFDAPSSFVEPIPTRETIELDHNYARQQGDATTTTQFHLADDILALCDGVESTNKVGAGEQTDFGYESMAVLSSPGEGSGSDSESSSTSTLSPKAVGTATVGSFGVVRPSLCYASPLSVLASFPIPRLKPLSKKEEIEVKPVELTDEEKDAFLAEGLPIPTTWPLTKVEEKTMKAVRRKIRNKACAAASRQKKKEYIDTLERRVQTCTEENQHLQKKVDSLQCQNRSLLAELKKLKQSISNSVQAVASSRSAQSGTCIMVLVLCFALVFPQWMPVRFLGRSSAQTPFDYTTPSVQGRSLLDYDDDWSFLGSAYNFMGYYMSWESEKKLRYDHPDVVAKATWTLNSTAVENSTTVDIVA